MKVGDRVKVRWGEFGVIESIEQKPYPAFPEPNLLAEVRMDSGPTHRLCLDGLEVQSS